MASIHPFEPESHLSSLEPSTGSFESEPLIGVRELKACPSGKVECLLNAKTTTETTVHEGQTENCLAIEQMQAFIYFC